MYERGIVDQVDKKTHRVKVKRPAKQDVVSGWLDVLVRATHGETDHGLPRVGTQVAVMFDENGEAGCVLGAIFSSADPAPDLPITTRRFTFGDGGFAEYDAAAKVLRFSVPPGGKLELAGNATPVSCSSKCDAEHAAIRDELAGHAHIAGALIAAGSPVTGMTGAAASISYSPTTVASAQATTA